MKEKINSEKICQGLLSIPIPRMRAFVNFVMACCSDTKAKSVVALTLSPHFHYHYSNISKVSELLTKDEEEYKKSFKLFLKYFIRSCEITPSFSDGLGTYYVLAQDMCVVDKTHSPCLEGRVYGHTANSLDKGIVAGYKTCFTHFRLAKSWSLPVAIDVVLPTSNDATILAVKQLDALFNDHELPFASSYCINAIDSGYGNAKFLSPLYKHENLINIVRFRGGMKVYKLFSGEQIANQKPKTYGDTFYLTAQTITKTFQTKHKKTKDIIITEKQQISIMDCPFDDFSEEKMVFENGKIGVKKIWCWKNLLIRTKNKNKMQDKPFDLLKVEIWNEDQTAKVFERAMFLSVNGVSKDKVNSVEAHAHYRTRFEAEGCYRFSKQQLFLDGFQTPDKQHFLNYLLVILCAWWLLYAAKEEVDLVCPVWQKYLPNQKTVVEAIEKAEKPNRTPSQVRKGISDLFHTFDKTPYLPRKYKKGQGREVGTIMTKRLKHKPYKKSPKEIKKE